MRINAEKGFEPALELDEDVALVGNSGRLAGSGRGREIDSHAEVVRFNWAVTRGHEADVGRRTTIRYMEVKEKTVNRKFPDWTPERQDLHIASHIPCPVLVTTCEEERMARLRAILEARGLDVRKHKMIWPADQVSCNAFLKKLGVGVAIGGHPRTGFSFSLALVGAGAHPFLYGFDHLPAEEVQTHYFDETRHRSRFHDFEGERMALYELWAMGRLTLR